jgi:hypothetical protein
VVASVLAAIALAGCGGSGGSHTTSSGVSQATSGRKKPATTPHAAGRLVPVNKSVVQSAPGATRVRVTLVAYQPDVAESSGNALTPKVFGITLRLTNLSAKALSAHAPTYYAVLGLADTAGAYTVTDAKGPCSGSFYSRRLHLAPRGVAQGCIPYAYGDSRPVSFGFGFSVRPTTWQLGSG